MDRRQDLYVCKLCQHKPMTAAQSTRHAVALHPWVAAWLTPCNAPQVGGSIIFIVAYWARLWTGRDHKDGSGSTLQRAPSGSTHGGMPMGASGMPMMGSVKSFYSSDPTGSEVEIAIQPGSARYAGGQMVMPPVGDGEFGVAAGLQG